MNSTTIYARTSSGEREAFVDSHEMARDLRRILLAIDGRQSVEGLRAQLGEISAVELDEALTVLAVEGYIRDAWEGQNAGETDDATAYAQSTLSGNESQRKAQALRAKIRARREGTDRSAFAPEAADVHGGVAVPRIDEQQARLEAAERARHEAEEEARRQAAERVQREAEEQARQQALTEERRQATARAQREAEERARQQAEEEARRQAIERAQREAEERARQQAEEEARLQEAEKARHQADAEERRLAAEQAQREAEERARQDAEALEWRDAEAEARRVRDEEAAAHVRWLAEEKAWREAEEKLRNEEEAAAGERANARTVVQSRISAAEMLRKWGKVLALGAVLLVAAGLAAIHLISFDGQIPQFEKLLAAQFQQPVKIKALRLGLLPQSHVALEGVSIGNDGQIRVARIKLAGGIGNLFGDRKAFKSVELESPAMTEEGLGWLLFGRAAVGSMKFGDVSAFNASIVSKNFSFPAFDAKLQSDSEGAWKSIAAESQDKNLTLELAAQNQRIQVSFKARSFKIPFGSTLTLEEMVATGVADRAGLALAEFKGFALGGILSGSADLKWGASWTLAGELNAKQIDTARLMPELMDGGRLAGKAVYALQATEAAKLFSAARMEGSFSIPRGTLLGTDLGSMMQGGSARGETKFTDLAGSFALDRGAIQLRQVSLVQGPLSVTGALDVDADRNVRGRFAADLRLSAETRRASLVVAGNLNKLEWRR